MYGSYTTSRALVWDAFKVAEINARDRLGDREFQVWRLLADVKIEIANRLAPHAAKVKPRWENGVEGRVTKGYGESLLNYMDVVNASRRYYDRALRGLGHELASLGHGFASDQEQIIQLRQEFIHVVQQLRHDPHKGPGMAFFAPDGGLIAYEAGNLWQPEVPFTRTEQIQLLESYSRREMAICGERTTIARTVGIKYPTLDEGCGEHKNDMSLTDRAISFMARHSLDIYLGAGTTDEFRGSTLHIAMKMCSSCLPPVVNSGIAEVIYDTDAASNGMRHIRWADMEDMTKNLPSHVAHREIVRQVPITLG